MKSEKSTIEVDLLEEVDVIFDTMVGLQKVSIEKSVERAVTHYRIVVEGFAALEEEEQSV